MVALTHEEALALLAEIGAIERGNTLKDILGNIEQTFGGQPLYPTVESRAAHLLYFIVRNHARLDGTKRGAEAVFQEYIMRNGLPVLPPQVIGRLLDEVEAVRWPPTVGQPSASRAHRCDDHRRTPPAATRNNSRSMNCPGPDWRATAPTSATPAGTLLLASSKGCGRPLRIGATSLPSVRQLLTWRAATPAAAPPHPHTCAAW